MVRRTAIRGLVLVGGIVVACDGEQAPESVRRYQLGDTVVVENLRPAIPDTVDPVEVRRYGLADGDADYLFSYIQSFAVDDSGRVHVHDSNSGIRTFDPDGSFRRHLSRNGRGPGEVDHVVGMAASTDGTVAALDLGNRRITLFKQGQEAVSTRMPEGRPRYRDGALVFTQQSDLYVGYNPPYPESGGIRHPRAIFMRLGEGGDFVDTISTPGWVAYHCPELSSFQHGRGFWEDNREPYIPKVKWALGADGTVAVGCAATYTFYVIAPDGSVTRIARARARVQMSDEELAFRAAMPVVEGRETLPAYAKILLSDDGRIWVWPTQPNERVAVDPQVAEQYGVSHTWSIPWQGAFDVFDRTGRWLAVVRLPERARYSGFPTEPGVVIRGDTIWAVEQDELDAQTIVRYEVSGLGRTLR